eukprot:jgi/Galph1/3144/GphlegSOOS_G1798.1
MDHSLLFINSGSLFATTRLNGKLSSAKSGFGGLPVVPIARKSTRSKIVARAEESKDSKESKDTPTSREVKAESKSEERKEVRRPMETSSSAQKAESPRAQSTINQKSTSSADQTGVKVSQAGVKDTTPIPKFSKDYLSANGVSTLPRIGFERVKEREYKIIPGRVHAGKFPTDETRAIMEMAYRRVFGNFYLFEADKVELKTIDSAFQNGRYRVKEYIRALAKSDVFRTKFFYNRPVYNSIELCFKMFLGRPCDNYVEFKNKTAIYDSEGFDSLVDSFFDDGEYDEAFGFDKVPYNRPYTLGTRNSTAQFAQLLRVSSRPVDADLQSNERKAYTVSIQTNRFGIQTVPRLLNRIAARRAMGGRPGPVGAPMAGYRMGVGADNEGKVYRLEVTGFTEWTVGAAGAPGIRLRSRTGRLYRHQSSMSAGVLSQYRRSNQAYLVPLNKMLDQMIKIHKRGGKIVGVSSA